MVTGAPAFPLKRHVLKKKIYRKVEEVEEVEEKEKPRSCTEEHGGFETNPFFPPCAPNDRRRSGQA
jgi:hypothetical protein